jgi:hypothetical protein
MEGRIEQGAVLAAVELLAVLEPQDRGAQALLRLGGRGEPAQDLERLSIISRTRG